MGPKGEKMARRWFGVVLRGEEEASAEDSTRSIASSVHSRRRDASDPQRPRRRRLHAHLSHAIPSLHLTTDHHRTRRSPHMRQRRSRTRQRRVLAKADANHAARLGQLTAEAIEDVLFGVNGVLDGDEVDETAFL